MNTASQIAPPAHRHVLFSPARVWAIASNALLELVRQKVFYFLLIFGFLLIGLGALFPQFGFEDQFQMVKDVCLGAMSIFTWLLSVLTTAMLLPKDIEDRTLYTILAKPVPRFEYLLGKLIGVFVLLLIATLIMAAVSAIALYSRQEYAVAETLRESVGAPQGQIQADLSEIYKSTFTMSLIPAVAIVYLKAALFATLTLFISTFASSWIFTIMVSIACYFIGILQGIARDVWIGSPATGALARIFLLLVTLLFPDMRLFNVVDDVVAGNALPFSLFAHTAIMGGFYIVIYFLVAYFVFSGKEL